MKRQGFLKAKSDLADAAKAMAGLRDATDFAGAEEAWLSFVEKFGRFFNKLAAATKGYPASEGWFSKKKAVRSNDETLGYLMQARNAAEHTIEDITERKPQSLFIGGSGSLFLNQLVSDASGVKGKIVGPPGTHVKIDPPTLVLLPVINRGETFVVPTKHLGVDIAATPLLLAELAIKYGESLLLEAEQILSIT